jgi:hypothetical protein
MLKRLIGWLTAPIAYIEDGVGNVKATVRTHHLLAVIAAVVLILLAVFGAFTAGRYAYPYKTVPRPHLAPGQVVPKPTSPQCGGIDHVMGGCLPHKPVPHIALSADIRVTSSGPDLSNNDPVSCAQMRLIAAHSAFVALKVNQGTHYSDWTAAGMASCARLYHLAAGGYDFLDFCAAAPQAEADLFVRLLIVDRLLGPGTLTPTGDAEWPLGALSCNARAWLLAWVYEVHRLTGRWPMIYTGAWWWDPHMGSYWPGGLLAWISGYTSSISFVPRPAGQGHIDLWQRSDHAFNGATYADLSQWLDGAAAFVSATLSRPPDPYAVFPKTRFAFGRFACPNSTASCGGLDHASEYNTVRTWDATCRTPVRRPVCKTTRYHLLLLRDRVWFVAHHHLVRGHWVPVGRARWSAPNKSIPFGSRFAAISRRAR